jgi:prefoldin subunit 5
MTDYSKWDKFCAEIDSDSDGVEDIESPPPAKTRAAEAAATSSKLHQPRLADTGGSTPLELNLLAQKVAEALKVEEKALEALKEKKQQCLDTQDVLSFMPSKTRHKVMVPCGSGGNGNSNGKSLLAFQEGELVHTNEVLVKLDKEVCVERTAAQAKSILERKQSLLDGQIKEAEASLQSLRSTLSFTSDATSENFIDIREEYESSSESECEDDKDASSASAQQKKKREGPLVTDEEFGEMMKKLDKFEKLELESEESSTSHNPNQQQQPTTIQGGAVPIQSAAGAVPSKVSGAGAVGPASTSASLKAKQERSIEEENQRKKSQYDAFSGKVVEKTNANVKVNVKSNPSSLGSSGGAEEPAIQTTKRSSSRPVSRFKMSLQK